MGARLIAPYMPTKEFLFIDRAIVVPNAPVQEWPDEKLIEFVDEWDKEIRTYDPDIYLPLNDCAMTYFAAWSELSRRTA